MTVEDPNKARVEPPDAAQLSEQQESAAAAEEENNQEFPIVGIGASAGGLAAFERFFAHMPPDSGMAFVVIQHLSSPHKSILPEILQRFTTMLVFQVSDGIEVKPNCVYVIPPSSNLALLDGHLLLLKPTQELGHRLPIDFFFRSLAKVRKNSAIGIVLSGTASDGSLGVKNIKAEGGLTIAQEPDTAEFGDMPRNAIATHDVDFVAPPEMMGELIMKYVNHQLIEAYRFTDGNGKLRSGGLHALYALLRAKTGQDFSLYKQNTILRRIERRIKITQVPDLDAYVGFLQQHPVEIEALFREMLINVTQFFRDPEAFKSLIEKVLPALVRMKHTTQTPLRVWVAGCSSGEEAYSIAIAIQEQIEAQRLDCKVQIYATDLDEEAIATARRGVYSDGSLENVSIERLQRFFNQDDDGYRIKRGIRDMVVFSTQNMIFDPPFSKIDLMCCRNLLIYLEPELQKQLFPMFHYALNPGGALFLGSSESIGGNADLFSVIDRKNKIFRRKEVETPPRLHTRLRSEAERPTLPGAEAGRRVGAGNLREWTEKALLKYHSPACIIIDDKHNVLYIHGRTGKYLEPPAGETNANLLRMAREGLKAELATALHTAVAKNETVRKAGIRVKTDGDFQTIDLTVRPVDWDGAALGYLMVVFEEVKASDAGAGAVTLEIATHQKPDHEHLKNQLVTNLEKELRDKDAYLNSIINELEEANQDLKSMNEELQSSNEEIQSSNEELETSKEELQSINEELSTVNAELQIKNGELTGLNNDVYNLMASTEIGTIFLDLDLRLRRFTPAIQYIYNFVPGDIGRPLSHFHSKLIYEPILDDIQEVLATLVPKAIEAQTGAGTWYLVNIKPYRTIENVIDGAVITFVDITEQKTGDELRRLATVIRDSNDAVTVQDFNGNILAWNRGAARLYGWDEAEALTMNILDMVPDDLQAETRELYARFSRGESMRSYETRRVTHSGSTLDVWVTMSVLVDDRNQPMGIASTERDITERKRADQSLRFENRSLKVLALLYNGFDDRETPTNRWREICQMLVDSAGYPLVWLASVENGAPESVRMVCSAGFAGEQSAAQTTPEAIVKQAWRTVQQALDSQRPVVMRSHPGEPSQAIGQADGLKIRYNSYIVLPFVHEGKALGALVIYAAEAEAFTDQEMDNLSLFSARIAKILGPDWQEVIREG